MTHFLARTWSAFIFPTAMVAIAAALIACENSSTDQWVIRAKQDVNFTVTEPSPQILIP